MRTHRGCCWRSSPTGDAGDERTATAVGHRLRLGVLDAALFNGTSSHRLDFDDVNVAFLGHASVAVLAATVALAEQLDSSVSELLTAYLAGYETTCRLAVRLGPQPYLRGFHATGTIGTIGQPPPARACWDSIPTGPRRRSESLPARRRA